MFLGMEFTAWKGKLMPEEHWHHLPCVVHIAGQALLMTSQSGSCTKYLIPTDNSIVLDW